MCEQRPSSPPPGDPIFKYALTPDICLCVRRVYDEIWISVEDWRDVLPPNALGRVFLLDRQTVDAYTPQAAIMLAETFLARNSEYFASALDAAQLLREPESSFNEQYVQDWLLHQGIRIGAELPPAEKSRSVVFDGAALTTHRERGIFILLAAMIEQQGGLLTLDDTLIDERQLQQQIQADWHFREGNVVVMMSKRAPALDPDQ